MWIRITSTFSVLRLLYFDLSTSSALLRLVYFDILLNPDFLLVEKHRSKYSVGLSKEVEVKFGQKGRSKVGGSKYRKGRRYENGRSTEKVELMRP